jgi:hypothetical protein
MPGVNDAAIENLVEDINNRFPNHPYTERVENPYRESLETK